MISFFELTYDDFDNMFVYLKVKSSKEYNVCIKLKDEIANVSPMDCDCDFGSMWSQTETNKSQKKICKHLIKSLELLEYLGYVKKWEYI